MGLGVILALAVLAIPIVAIVALVKAQNSERELRRVDERVDRALRELGELSSRLEEFRSGSLPSAVAPRPSAGLPPETMPDTEQAPSVAVHAADTPDAGAPSGAAGSRPAAAPVPVEGVGARGLEEALTSRWFVWLGAVAVALAGTFLVKYAIDEGWLGPAMRCSLGFLLGVVLAIAGEWLRRRPLQKAIAAIRPDYVPPSLSASGLFIAFASIYAAYGLYHLLNPLVAFAALALVALVAVGLSLLQGIFVALMGVLGGFVTPMLISTPSPSAWALFTYLLIIQAAALAVARYKGWWWLALATLAGAAFWPLAWMAGYWQPSDEVPLGVYLLLTSITFYLVRRGWESAEGSADWLEEIRHVHTPERVVWIAACLITLLLLIVVRASDYSAASLVLFAIAAVLYLVAGRREGIFDGLPVVIAFATLAIMITMPLPDAVARLMRPHAPVVPPVLESFTTASLAFGALFAFGGFAALWGAKRPALWAGISAAMPVLLLTVAYWRIVDLNVDFRWAAIAVALAALSLVAAERVERYRATRGLVDSLGLYAAGIVALLSLAATMSLREAWLTVALSIQLPLLAWIHQRIAVRPIRVLAAIVAGVVLVRLVLNYEVLTYALAGNPLLSWVVYGYGIPAISFFAAAYFFRKATTGLVVTLLDAGGLAFSVLLVSFEIRVLITGSLNALQYTLLEQSLQSISWLAIGSVLAFHHLRRANRVSLFGSRFLLSLAAGQVLLVQLLSSNPIMTQEFVGNYLLVDVLFLAYAIPAGFALALSTKFSRGGEGQIAKFAAIAGFLLLFAYVTLEVRHAFQGPILQATHQSDAELYSYSVVWLFYAVTLLSLGIVFRQAVLRYASLAILIVVALKVFLVDMGDLAGLYRVASFLGLGLSLVGIGLVYQRFVFPRPDAR